ncbi:ApeP family dehydratase [Avibacterium sp. 21-599]|uniref:ApeP family dehydratase n=1 Tax=Avibacterium sp. 21-599 TaxID=2911528 RepID=UPI0022452CA1|nr:dehydratase [Avibacterium sp. 21-599]MCW9717216.1 dehydratase [Avibacterium sp. 21-599]
MFDLTCPITNIAPLLPHSGEMVLLQQLDEVGEDFLVAQAQVSADHILLKNGKLASFVGAEIMAQGIAAWAGCKCVRAGQPIGLGYWLGTRKLHIYQQAIPIGSTLEIRVHRSLEDDTGFGVFDCQLRNKNTNELIIEGTLNVLRPPKERKV